jgi:hypothetical protein
MQPQQDGPRSGLLGFQQGSTASRVDGLMDSIGLDVGHFAPLETSIAGRLSKGDAGRSSSSSVQLTSDEIAEIAKEIRMHEDRGAMTFETVAYVGTALSSGYVIWCLRAGTFVAGALSTIPAWASFDPLPVVEFWEKDRKPSKDDHELDASFGPMPDEEPSQ